MTKQILKILAAFMVVSIMAGCDTMKMTKVEPGKIKFVCVIKNETVKKPIVLETIEEGLTNHGMNYRVIPGTVTLQPADDKAWISHLVWTANFKPSDASGCDSVLYYSVTWASLNITHNSFHDADVFLTTPEPKGKVLGKARFTNAGFNNWFNEHHKLLDLMGDIFGSYKSVKGETKVSQAQVNAAGIKEDKTTSASVSQRLRELQQLKKDGLISDSDYQKKKKQILDQL